MFEFRVMMDEQAFDDFASNHPMSSINQSIYWPKKLKITGNHSLLVYIVIKSW